MPTPGKTLRAVRQSQHLSQRALAAKAGLGQNMVARVEQDADVRLSTLTRLGRAADLEVMLVPRHMVLVIESVLAGVAAGLSLDEIAAKPLYTIYPDI